MLQSGNGCIRLDRVPSTVLSAAAVIVLLSAHGGLSTAPSAFVQRQKGMNAATTVPTCASSAAAPEWFTDCAQAAGLDFVHFNGMSGEYYIQEVMGSGVALFDFDNDGDLDVYLIQGQMLGRGKTLADALLPPRMPLPLTDRLYRNDLDVHADGSRTLRFTDVTTRSGLDVRSYGMGVATGDIDNDGWIDLYRTRLGTNQLFRNNRDGTFTDISARAGTSHPGWSISASFLDFDRDGWLDLYVGNYIDLGIEDRVCRSGSASTRDYCGPELYVPVPDRLYRNRGDGSFADVSDKARVASEYGPALGVVAADFNADRWVDVYVANDGQENLLWMNRQDGTFKNDALLAGAALNAAGAALAGMGVDAGDVDNDGDEDLFVTNLKEQTNTLYINDGSGQFDDQTARWGLAAPSLPYSGFGTLFFDYDNDGWLDILAANGAVFVIKALADANDPHPLKERNSLYRNLGNGRFTEVSTRAGAVFQLTEVSRGAAFGDLDNDGDMDVVVTNNGGPVRLLLNNVGNRTRWLGLRLVGGSPPRDMLGARIGVFRRDGPPLWRRARTDGSYASAHDPRVLVGLGAARAVPRVQVIWPNGSVEEWTDLKVDQWLTLTQGSGRRVRR